MTKVYPNTSVSEATKPPGSGNGSVMVLTVWKKSLLFNFNGFTVFDTKGNLVFRVDNYASGNKAEIVLMDASGHSLLTIRRKILSLGDNWLVYEGETAVNPIFSVKKNINLFNPKCLANVISSKKATLYEMEGSYGQRCCKVYDKERICVAEIKRKEAIGGAAFAVDVFRLIVQPEIDPSVAMAFVILLEQMFG